MSLIIDGNNNLNFKLRRSWFFIYGLIWIIWLLIHINNSSLSKSFLLSRKLDIHSFLLTLLCRKQEQNILEYGNWKSNLIIVHVILLPEVQLVFLLSWYSWFSEKYWFEYFIFLRELGINNLHNIIKIKGSWLQHQIQKTKERCSIVLISRKLQKAKNKNKPKTPQQPKKNPQNKYSQPLFYCFTVSKTNSTRWNCAKQS